MTKTCRPLKGYRDFQQCYELQEAIWGRGFSGGVQPVMQMIIDKMGGVVSGAFDGQDRMTGFVLGLTGLYRGRLAHWSHMLGVRPGWGGHGLGQQLKWHQRQQVLEAGIEDVLWTYDPLESRNAHLNLNRLGAWVEEYQRDVYPTSESPRHGHGTDRFLVRWKLRDPRVERLARGRRAHPSGEAEAEVRHSGCRVQEAEAPLAHQGVEEAGVPSPGGWRADRRVRVEIPAEIESVKGTSPRAGRAWRLFTRAAFEHYLGRRYRVTGYLPPGRKGQGEEGERRGSYLLEAP
ncbi:MAG TPA: hypothetical protein VLV83_26490 [Acidobacteriota bacterium]|nr:hypothetical protein [Acidobacteriota bacterium]